MKKTLFFTSLLALGSSTLKDTTYLQRLDPWTGNTDIENWIGIRGYGKSDADASSCDLSYCHDGQRTAKAYQVSVHDDPNEKDSQKEYTLCVCDNPGIDEPAAMFRMTLIPTFIRKYTNTFIIASANYEGPVGSSEDGDAIIFKEPMRGGAVIRAATRNYDIKTKISQSAEWQKAVASDKCVYDPYSNINQAKNFANMPLVYMRTLAEENTIDCMKNQLAFFAKLVPSTEKFSTKAYADVTSKPVLLPDRQRWVGEESLEKYYLSTPYKTSPGGDSSKCLLHDCGGRDPQMFTVSYEDGTSHKFCVCGDSVVTLETAATRWGIVPKFIREHTNTLTIASNGAEHDGVVGTGTRKQIIIRSDVPSGAYVYEGTRNFDANVQNGVTLSETKDWVKAEDQDSCIPVSFGTVSPTENFAEVSVVRMLLPFLKVDGSCMKNQVEQFEKWIPSGASKTGTLKPEFKGKFLAK